MTSHAAFLRKHVPGRKRKQPSAFIPSSIHVAEERHVASLQPFRTNAAGCRSLGDSGQCLNDPKLPRFLFLIFFFFFTVSFMYNNNGKKLIVKKEPRFQTEDPGEKKKKVDRIRERITCLSPPPRPPSVRHPSMRNVRLGGCRPRRGAVRRHAHAEIKGKKLGPVLVLLEKPCVVKASDT